MTAESNAQDKVNILLVDDRPDKLMALELVLAELGQNLVKVTSGAEALRALLREEFAVIILDVSMPIMDGFEAAALIRQRRNSEHTPIIFVTGINTTETHVSRGYSLGAVDYIFSPVEPSMLRAKVTVFIDLYKKTQQVKRQESWLRQEAERRAMELETRLHGLLNRLNLGVFRFTPAGRLLDANPAFLRLLGLETIEAAASRDLRALYMHATRADGHDDSQLGESDVQINRADGRKIWVALTSAEIRSAEGESFVDGVIEDISVRKVAEEALIKKSEELARSNSDLEEFAFIASHDLQEPLRIISSYAALLLKRFGDDIDKDARDYVTRMAEASKRMYALINDLLSFSRAHGRDSAPSAANCDDVTDRAIFNLRAAIEESRAVVTRDSLPAVQGDGIMLCQLFQNLIGNAIKFRGEQPARIHVSAKIHISAERNERTFWEFAIKDNGIGIPKEHIDQIFKVFKRLHRRDVYPGTGIGLALCRKVVERHDGKIWVDSVPGEGSTFRFTLPAATSPEKRSEISEPIAAGEIA